MTVKRPRKSLLWFIEVMALAAVLASAVMFQGMCLAESGTAHVALHHPMTATSDSIAVSLDGHCEPDLHHQGDEQLRELTTSALTSSDVEVPAATAPSPLRTADDARNGVPGLHCALTGAELLLQLCVSRI